MKPILYYRTVEGVAFDNFCSDAAIGARDLGIEVKNFEDKLPEYNPYNVVVTSVEETLEYLQKGIKIIDHSWAEEFFGRRVEKRKSIKEVKNYPCFIKPAEGIKDWTGIVVENREQVKLFTQNYKKPILEQEIIDIESEYRVYVGQRGILGIKHYLGDPYKTPQKEMVEKIYRKSKQNLKELSYTLDIGTNNKGETFLIEINDGWSIGNYGLKPTDYYIFVRDRFLQLTGVLR